MKRGLGALVLLAALGGASAQEAPAPLGQGDVQGALALLGRGTLVLTPPNAADATAIARIDAPVEQVWETILDFKAYTRFVPRVVRAQPTQGDAQIDVEYEVEVPGANPRYTIRWTVDSERRVLDGRWLKGSLGGGQWRWALFAVEGGTVACYTAHADAGPASRLMRQFDDRYRSLAVSLDVSSALLMVRAVGDEASKRAAKRAKVGRRF